MSKDDKEKLEDELELIDLELDEDLFDVDCIGIPRFDTNIKLDVPKSKKCECGAHTVKSNKHSDYCPLYEEED